MRKATLMLSFLLVFVTFARPAHAVIPQLLGPLSALLSIIPQILAFVGVALITVLVFARDTTKMFLYRLRDFAAAHKAVAALLSLIIVAGLAWGTYQFITLSRTPMATLPEANIQERSQANVRTNTT